MCNVKWCGCFVSKVNARDGLMKLHDTVIFFRAQKVVLSAKKCGT